MAHLAIKRGRGGTCYVHGEKVIPKKKLKLCFGIGNRFKLLINLSTVLLEIYLQKSRKSIEFTVLYLLRCRIFRMSQ